MKVHLMLLVVSAWFIGASIASVAAPRPAFSFEDLRALIESREIFSLEQLLPELPAEFRINYVLESTSHSTQAADFTRPRVLLFGRDASLTMTFNGTPSQHGYSTLELFQYRKDTHSFEFRQVDFSGARPVFSDPNPPRCLSCHRADPSPVWGVYGRWEEIYRVGEGEGYGNIDAQTYDRVFGKFAENLRYRHLVLPHVRASGNTDNYNAGWPVKGTDRVDGPPWIFGYYLGNLQSDHVSDRILRSPMFVLHRPALLGYFAGCQGIALPLVEQRIAEVFARLYPATDYPDLHAELPPASSNEYDQVKLRWKFQLEKVLTGLDLYRWDLRLPPGPNGDGRYFMGHSAIDQTITAQVVYKSGWFTRTPVEDGFGWGDAVLKEFGTEAGARVFERECRKLVTAAEADLKQAW